jgi:hypothetical protein
MTADSPTVIFHASETSALKYRRSSQIPPPTFSVATFFA